MIAVAQVLIAAIEFFLINWLGRHSITSGYHTLSFMQDFEESPLFNIVYRVLAPTVFLVISAAVLFSLHLDALVNDYWHVTGFYFLGRWAFNLVLNRGRLLRWYQQLATAVASVSLSILVYGQFLGDRTELLPSGRGLTDQLWIVVILFLYHTYERAAFPQRGVRAHERKVGFIKSRYGHFEPLYGEAIRAEAGDRNLEALSFAVMIYEDFNRPTAYRFIERRLLFPVGLARSLGPMQVQTSDALSDIELVRLGVRKLRDDFGIALANVTVRITSPKPKGESFSDQPYSWRTAVLAGTAKRYNIRSDYGGEVIAILKVLHREYYPDLMS